MKIQEQIINYENGIQYWKIYFEYINTNQLTLIQWEKINNQINNLINEINNEN